MKRNLINTPLFALFAGAFLFESGTAFASSPVIIGEGTYDSAIYATEEDTTGGSSLYINGGTFNLYSSVSNPDLYLYGGGSEGVSITGISDLTLAKSCRGIGRTAFTGEAL